MATVTAIATDRLPVGRLVTYFGLLCKDRSNPTKSRPPDVPGALQFHHWTVSPLVASIRDAPRFVRRCWIFFQHFSAAMAPSSERF